MRVEFRGTTVGAVVDERNLDLCVGYACQPLRIQRGKESLAPLEPVERADGNNGFDLAHPTHRKLSAQISRPPSTQLPSRPFGFTRT